MDEETLMKKRKKAQRDGNVQVLADVQKKLGDLYYDRKCLDEALEAYKGQLQACECLNDKLNSGIAHRMIGEVYCDMCKYDDALRHQNLYLEIARQLNDLLEEQRALATLGRTYLCKADNLLKESEKDEKMEVLKDANKAFSKSIKMCDKLGNKISISELMMMRARLMLNLGLVREQQKNTEEALKLIKQAEEICRKHNLSEDKHRTNIALAGLNERLGNTELALKNLDDAAKVEDSSLRNNARLLKAEMLLKFGEWLEAKRILHNLYKHKKLVEPDKQQVVKLLRIAVVLNQSEDKLLMETSTSAKEKLYEIMGDAAVGVRSYDKAIEYYERMLICADETNSPQLGAALTSLAQTLRDAGRYEEAVPYARRELELYSDPKEVCNSALFLAGLLIEAKREHSEIREMFEKALNAAKKCDPSLERTVLKMMLEYHERADDVDLVEIEALNERLEALPSSQSQESEEEEPETPDIGADICLDELSDSEPEETSDRQQARNVARVTSKRHRCVVKRNEKGETQLHVACIRGNVSAVSKLLDEQHPTAVRDHCGWTPLHEASNHGFTEIVRLLIRAGANVNDQGGANCDGVTALHDAAANGHSSVVQLLLESGADPNLLTKSGDTALDCLEQWKERVSDLTPSELKDFVLVKRRLIESTTVSRKNKKKAQKKASSGYQALIDENAEDEQEIIVSAVDTWDRPEKISAGEDYKRTIASMQHRSRLTAPTKPIFKSAKITAPLIDSEEMLFVDEDWLEDDIGSSHSKRDKPYFDGVPPAVNVANTSSTTVKRKSKTDSDIEVDVDKSTKRQRLSDLQPVSKKTDDESSRDSNASDPGPTDPFESWPKKKKPRQLSLLKQGFTKNNQVSRSPSPIECNSVIPEPVAYTPSILRSEHERRSWESSISENFDLEITLDGQFFALTLHFRDLRKTLNNIEELIRHKFEAITGCRPRIRFKTIEGVVLPGEMSLEDVPRDKGKLVLCGEITQNELPPIADRYKKICETLGIDVTDAMLKSLRSCENTSTFRLNNHNSDAVVDEELEPLAKCLHYQINLQSLNLSSATFFARGDLLDLAISKLNGLCELHLQCCDIDDECLGKIQKLPAELRVLDLAYNPLGYKSQQKLLELIEPLKRLQTLNLRACELDDFRFKYSSDSLVSLDISWNPIGGDGAANFLQRQLLSLNLSNTLSSRSNVIDKVFFNDSENFSFATLECLELSSCQATDFDVEKVLSKTPNLTRLVLNNNPNVTRTSLFAILTRKPTLSYIDLSGCKLIEEPPQPNLRIVTPQVCTLLVNMKSSVVEAWEALWQDKGRAKKLPHSMVMFRPS